MEEMANQELDELKLIDLFNSSDIEGCIAACEKALEVNSLHAMANNLLGSCWAKKKQFSKAKFYLSAAVTQNPSNPTFLYNLGLAEFETNEFDKAIGNYEKALKLNNEVPSLYFNLARTYEAVGNSQKAIEGYKSAITCDAKYQKAYVNLGELYEKSNLVVEAKAVYEELIGINNRSKTAWSRLGRCFTKLKQFDDSFHCYGKAAELDDRNPFVAHNLGFSLWKLGRFEESIKQYERAITINSDYAEAYSHMGVACMAANNTKKGISSFEKSLSINNKSGSTHFNYANALKTLKKWGTAIKHYRKAIEIDSKNDGAYVNMAVVYNELGLDEESYRLAKRALEINPLRKEGYTNLGNYYLSRCKVDKALNFYHQATEIDANYVGSLWNESFIYLLKGDFQKGWELYKTRWNKSEFRSVRARMSGEQWKGQSLSGKSILLHHEQGIGDTFQFIRYANVLEKLGARVYIDCPVSIIEIVKSVDGVSGVYSSVESFPEYDYYCPLLDLPSLLETTLDTVPNEVPYIKVSKSKRSVIEVGNKINVGVVWAGNPQHAKDKLRSCDFRYFDKLFRKSDDAFFYSLQVGDKAEEIELSTHIGESVEDLSAELKSYSDTARIINELDLVITVDTSVAHLAGALGKPVWTLVQYSPDWRWMLEREDSPWYPSMRLFRQKVRNNWADVFDELAEALKEFKPERLKGS